MWEAPGQGQHRDGVTGGDRGQNEDAQESGHREQQGPRLELGGLRTWKGPTEDDEIGHKEVQTEIQAWGAEPGAAKLTETEVEDERLKGGCPGLGLGLGSQCLVRIEFRFRKLERVLQEQH